MLAKKDSSTKRRGMQATRLDEIAKTVNDEHSKIEGALREGLTRALKVGELLTEAKGLIKHGDWGEWISAHCVFSERTAQNYMRLSERYPELAKSATVADLTYRQAVGLLAEPKAEDPKRVMFPYDGSFLELMYWAFAEEKRVVESPPGLATEEEWQKVDKETDKLIKAGNSIAALRMLNDFRRRCFATIQPFEKARLLGNIAAVGFIKELREDKAPESEIQILEESVFGKKGRKSQPERGHQLDALAKMPFEVLIQAADELERSGNEITTYRLWRECTQCIEADDE